MKAVFLCILILQVNFSESRGVRRKKLLDELSDYDASGDYFEVTVNNVDKESLKEMTTKKTTSDEEVSSDDGVTCSSSNITDVLLGYELENHVVVIFKVNVSANERETVLFLNLAKRFSDMSSIFHDLKFLVITSDHSSEVVMDFIEKEDFPSDIIVIDEDEFTDFGFVVDLDELHVYVLDQCSKLTFIVVPPWSSAQHPYVKAAIISTIIDLSCGCPAEEFASNIESNPSTENTKEITEENDPLPTVLRELGTTTESTSSSNVPVIDIDTDEVENIEDLLDNLNGLNSSENNRTTSETELPLRIIIPSEHMHFDNETQSYWKYDQFVLQTGNQSHHTHLQNGEKLLEIQNDTESFFNITSIDAKIFVGNRSLNDIQKIAKSDRIFLDRSGRTYKIHKELFGAESIYELIPVDFDIIKVAPVQKLFGVRHHYEQLNRWLMFKI